MPGLFGIYELGRHSLLAQQMALQTAGHNLANAATPGYHRQRVEAVPTLPELTAFGALGTGVRVDTIRRIEDRFLELSVQREIPLLSRFSARAAVMAEAELTFGEPTDGGMQSFMEQFFDSWDDLASAPEDLGARESVVRSAMTLAGSIRTARVRFDERRDALTGEIRAAVDDANRVLRELESVNRGIMSQNARRADLGDLADRRDLLIETLADLVGAESAIDDDGTAMVRIGGRTILQAEIAGEIAWDDGTAQAPVIAGRSIEVGEIEGRVGGLMDARDGDLAAAIRGLDELAVRLANDVNAIHANGVDANGRPAGAFFTLAALGQDGVTNAAVSIDVAAALAQDSSRVAAGRGSAAGDNSLALEMAELRSRREGPASLLSALVVDVGSRARESADLARGQEIVVDSIRAQRESVVGVSLDEEGADLLRFQRSYQAAAQLISIADELAQTVLAL